MATVDRQPDPEREEDDEQERGDQKAPAGRSPPAHRKQRHDHERRHADVGPTLCVIAGEADNKMSRPPAADGRHRRNDEIGEVGAEEPCAPRRPITGRAHHVVEEWSGEDGGESVRSDQRQNDSAEPSPRGGNEERREHEPAGEHEAQGEQDLGRDQRLRRKQRPHPDGESSPRQIPLDEADDEQRGDGNEEDRRGVDVGQLGRH